jgi:ribulose bisphosphate carboxylase small subunit
MVGEVNRILSQGQRLGIEYVDDRRFRTGSWQCYGTFEGDASVALSALDSCLGDRPRDYIRLVGITPQDRRRMTEMLVQRSS